MAILLEGCDGAAVMWGKIGDYVVQRTKTGRMFIRRYVKPTNPQTMAQQRNRNAFREGILRWTTHESLTQKDYWEGVAKTKGFRDGYRAFLSSYMMIYQRKIGEFGDENLALDWVKNVGNSLSYEESPGKKSLEQSNKDFIAGVLRRRNSSLFVTEVDRSVRYLQSKGWLDRMRYGLLPMTDSVSEWEILSLGLVVPA